MTDLRPAERLEGFLLGSAVGDAIGLPREGLSARRGQRIYGTGPLQHRLLLSHGAFSDDTEHLVMTALALCEAPTDASQFADALARRFKFWLAAVPAGVGLATARSIFKLWMGVSADRSGVFSAGNGPAMRSGLLGLHFADNPDRMTEFVRAATRITHLDPRAETGALAIAHAARWNAIHAVPSPLDEFWHQLRQLSPDREWEQWLNRIQSTLMAGDSEAEFAARCEIKSGVRGYIYETVSAALFCWLRHPGDFRTAVESAVCLGGDTDTVAAIVGGLAGSAMGSQSIPEEWLRSIHDWPLSIGRIRQLGQVLAQPGGQPDLKSLGWDFPHLVTPLRNLIFLSVVLGHGFRRLLPPY